MEEQQVIANMDSATSHDNGVRGKLRNYKGIWATFVSITSVALIAYQVLYAVAIFHYVGIFIPEQTHLAISLGLLLALTFLLVPEGKNAPRDRLPWYDLLLCLASLTSGGYIAYFFATKVALMTMLTTSELIVGCLTILIVLEGIRRTVGWAIVLIIVAFFFIAFFGNYLPGALYTKGYGVSRLVAQNVYSTYGIYGSVLRIGVTVVIIFILFAAFLRNTGAARFFTDCALSLFGSVRGGPAKVAIVASALFGTISGATVANVASTGIITIPLMKRIGYKPHFAAAVEAVASTGGQLMPPVMGAAAFIMAEFLEVPYLSIVYAAIIPAIIYFFALFIAVDLQAAKMGLRGLPQQQLPSAKKTFSKGWPHLIALGVLLWFLVKMRYSVTMSGVYAILALVFVNLFRKEARISPSKLAKIMEEGARGTIELVPVLAGAGMIAAIITLTGLGLNLAKFLTDLSGGNLFLMLVLVAFAALVLGMGLPTVPCYIILALLLVPAIVRMGAVDIAAHMFIFYFGMLAAVTPPVCIAAFVAASLADASFYRTGFQALSLAIGGFIIPFVFVYDPTILLIGLRIWSVVTIAITILGVVSLSSAVAGYLLRPMNWLERILFAVAGLTMVVPEWKTDIFGVILLAVLLAWQLIKWMKVKPKAKKESSPP